MRTPAITLAAAALMLCLTLSVTAAPIPHGPEIVSGLIDRALNDPEIREQANITDEQADALSALSLTTQRTLITQRAEVEIARLELQDLWRADEPDAEAIHAAIDRVNTLETAIQHTMADARIQSMEILTAEQRDTLRTIARERIQDRMAERRGGDGDEAGPQRRALFQGLGDRGGFGPRADAGDRPGPGGQRGAQLGGPVQ